MGNAKLSKHTAIFSLPAGHSCPAALLCSSKSDRITGKLTDGPKCQFRCYAASGENLFKNIRVSRWRNFELLKQCTSSLGMADLICRSMPSRNVKLCRIHSSGDFFNQTYFDAWILAAYRLPHITFYAYTKALPYWIKRKEYLPFNMRLVASRGGVYDALIEKHNLRNVKVVFSDAEAITANLPLDHNDTHAWEHTGNFAILIHGTQPAGTVAGKVMYALRRAGKNGYKSGYFDHYSKAK